MRHIGLISCTEQKLDHPALARDLYVGNSFISGRDILERLCDDWYILSAEHGLIDPQLTLQPYDRSLEDMSDWAYADWILDMERSVANLTPDKVTLIGPDAYVKYLVSVLPKHDIEVERRPRVDIHGGRPYYMACEQCGACGPLRPLHEQAVDDAIGHPCRVKEVD